jgi:hypothetical protein
MASSPEGNIVNTGVLAFASGLKMKDNPFAPGSKAHYFWEKGWKRASDLKSVQKELDTFARKIWAKR